MKNRVRELRKNQKLTQEELAELIGISRQAINAIEKEKFDPSLPTAFKMAKLFKTSIEDLFMYENKWKQKHFFLFTIILAHKLNTVHIKFVE